MVVPEGAEVIIVPGVQVVRGEAYVAEALSNSLSNSSKELSPDVAFP